MNRVGHAGRGESVWLGWFLVAVLNDFATICERRGRCRSWRNATGARRDWLTGMLELAWDGDWYRRAYFDDGTPLGSVQNEECRIDSLTQSWAVLSRRRRPGRRRRARWTPCARTSCAATRRSCCCSRRRSIACRTIPGYIKGYVPGVRENGGQYTHAALWTVMALARLGLGDEAMELFHMINPINHMRTPEGARAIPRGAVRRGRRRLRAPDALGRGGWTWYTGSAGWMYQAAVERAARTAAHGATPSASTHAFRRCGRSTRSTGRRAERGTTLPSAIQSIASVASGPRRSTA